MVLESLVNPRKAEGHPARLFLLGLAYSSIGLLLSLWVFYNPNSPKEAQWSSLVMVFLTVMASLPLLFHTIRKEEAKDKQIHDELTLLKEHGKVLLFLVLLFLGFVVGFSIWYLILPEKIVENAFHAQATTIAAINAPTGRVVSFGTFMRIFSNNIRVLFFCVFFSFFYGCGAIFILTWNASIIGTAMGNLIRTKLSELAGSMGFVSAGRYLHVFTLSIIRYLPHGILEIASYFIGGLAGGIISVAVIRHDFGEKEFNHIIADALDLVIIAIIVLFVATLVEVYVTPGLFKVSGG